MENINYGIDLGTTNSGIAKYENGKVTIFKNPVGFRETVPSVVSYRRGRLQVGEKAREQFSDNTGNVFSSFKRKMGSDESYAVPDTGENVTPISLSALVLRELFGFAPVPPQTCVITIPASFDTIQSNATKKAGYDAGLKEVVLLQEPIAACLAYSNSNQPAPERECKWLVYDFGGGTFDVALVSIDARELKVIDHKGNNFLGGLDLDNLFVEKLLCPEIERMSGRMNLWADMVAGNDKAMRKTYFELLFRAEEAKKELSLKPESVIEFDDENLGISADIAVKRQDFEALIAGKFEESFRLTEKLIEANGLTFGDIERLILVGGTTYIPYVRQELARRTGITVDSSIDPTTAVITGAAFYAGSKPSQLDEADAPIIQPFAVNLELIYEPHSRDAEELLAGIISPLTDGFYRIVRADGGFDTGLMRTSGKFSEFVPVLDKATNLFTVTVFDDGQNLVAQGNAAITSGLYNITGQPLPHDISLELDESQGVTRLERIFKKNDILPLKKTIYKTSSKNIPKQSDDKLVINVVEGNAGGMVGSNLSIGYIEISGKDLASDLIKGMDIELNFRISESRDLSIEVYIGSLGLEISEVFNPHERKVSTEKLVSETEVVMATISYDIQSQEGEEQYEYMARLQRIYKRLEVLRNEARAAEHDHATDKKYQLDEAKRLCIQEYDDLVRHKHVLTELEAFHAASQYLARYIENGNDRQREAFERMRRDENEIAGSGNKYLIRKRRKEMEDLIDDVFEQQEDRFVDYFYFYRMQDADNYSDKRKMAKLIELGGHAVDKKNYTELRSICNQLWQLLINKPKTRDQFNSFDGDLGLK